MQSFGELIRGLREEKGYLIRQVAAALEMDQAAVSKFEKGERKPNREMVLAFEKFFEVKPGSLLVAWLSDKVVYDLREEEMALTVLQIAEERLVYQRQHKE